MAIPKNVFLGLIYKFPFTGITALRLCVLTSKNVRLYALTQKENHPKEALRKEAPPFASKVRCLTTPVSNSIMTKTNRDLYGGPNEQN